MKLRNEFTVPVTADQVWPVLLDIERVAACLPGAAIEPAQDDGVFHGTMKVKLGPVTTRYRGTARLQDVDEDARTVSIAVEAREAKGSGMAAAVITNRLVAEGDGTRVIAETDLKVTGRQAQFGRGIMEDVAGRMLDAFAQEFERELLEGPRAAAANGAAPSAAAPSPADPAGEPAEPAHQAPPAGDRRPEPDALDLGSVLRGGRPAQLGGLAALVVLVLTIAGLRARRPRGLELRLRYRC